MAGGLDGGAGVVIPIGVDAAIPIPSSVEATAYHDEPSGAGQREGRGAIGGRLEFLSGKLGSGTAVIWRFGRAARIGFVAPAGRLVDLGAELEGVAAWPDRGDHRIVGAAGWAWVLGSLGGAIGIVAGAGLRLLVPRRMMARIRLRDGSEFVVRTDRATVTALEAIARACAIHRAASVPA
ncbi:MAG: hypothetical protein ACREFD_03850 [Stellaceae bacterium]